jgi:hypothetical protein
MWIAANTESLSCLKVLTTITNAALDDDFQDVSPIETLCQRRTVPNSHRLQCIAHLVLAGACVTAGYVDEITRPSVKAWAQHQVASQYAPVFVAIAAREGHDADGAPCALASLDGRMLKIIGGYLRRPKKQMRRVHRLMWVLQSEDDDAAMRAAAAARGFRREDHCFVVS